MLFQINGALGGSVVEAGALVSKSPPYDVDITKAAPAGKKAVISYTGLFQGKTPPAQTKKGNVLLESYLVIYE